ncbi:MAG: aminodeoxychorismate lyase [Gammaproteobacteria bacterium]|nr:aminodeoxychorismate lyase [Gammaproteobacteria bacterium]
MIAAVLINGVATGQLAVSDRGLHYGDGLFETVAVRNGKLCLWRRHWKRMASGAQRLGIEIGDENAWLDDINSILAPNQDAVIKLVLTRGPGGRGYVVPEKVEPVRIVMRSAVPDYHSDWFTQGVRARYCHTRLGGNVSLAGIKHLNRLEQVMARNEWPPAVAIDDFVEGLMLDQQGMVIEGITSNVFLVRQDTIHTPVLESSGVAGVMRDEIIDHARSVGISVSIDHVSTGQVSDADEVFLSNSLIGLWRVKQLENRLYKTGEIARMLQQHVKEMSFASLHV